MLNLPLSGLEKRKLEQIIESNILFAIFSIGFCFFIALIHLFIPDWRQLLFPVTTLQSKVLDYVGIFFVKISFICNVVLYFQVNDKFSFQHDLLNAEKILRLESLIVLTNVLLSVGVFIYIPNAFSLATFFYTVCYFSYRKFRN
jgi:hypothetical protein